MIKKILLSNLFIFICFIVSNLLINWVFPIDTSMTNAISELTNTNEFSQNQINLIEAGLNYTATTKFFIISLIISSLVSYLIYYFFINIFTKNNPIKINNRGNIISRSFFLGLIPLIGFNLFEIIVLFVNSKLADSLFLNICYFIALISSIEVSFKYLAQNGFKLTKQKFIIYIIATTSIIILYLFKYNI